jgi:hypothetical protein
LRGKAGWLRVAKLRVATPAYTREHLLLSAFADDGSEVHAETAERLLGVPAQSVGQSTRAPPANILDAREDAQRRSLLELAEQQNAEWLDRENDKLDAYADDLEKAFESEVKALEGEIREAKKALRGSNMAMTEKLAEKRRISSLEAKRDKMKAEYFDRRAKLRAEVDAMLDQIQESLKIKPSLAPLFTVRWEVQ